MNWRIPQATVTSMSGIRVGVVGAAGRMGTSVCDAVAADPDLELVACVGRSAAGQDLHGVTVAKELRALADAACDVVVDFTVAAAARVTLPWLAMHGIHAVVGTTGFTDADLDMVRSSFGGGKANCLIAPNFAISAVLMMRFAEMAAPFFDTAEIIEYHHNAKVDAPSGTAITTASRMAAARGESAWAADPTTDEVLTGARGGAGESGIRVHELAPERRGLEQVVLEATSGLPGESREPR